MRIERIGFIGGGRVTRILLQAFRQARVLPASVIVHDTSEEVLRKLGQDFPEVKLDSERLEKAAGQEVVFLSLHPPVMSDTLPLLSPYLGANTIVVSLAPRLTIAKISELLGGFERVIRMIPNAPSIIGRGYNPVTYAPSLSDSDQLILAPLFASLGSCPVVPEEHLEAYAIITAMGPTYLWFQLQELTLLAQRFGLSQEKAVEGVAEMARGAIATLFDSGLTPEAVMDLVPLKPLAEKESEIVATYEQKLGALYAKLKN